VRESHEQAALVERGEIARVFVFDHSLFHPPVPAS
jgi:hypothetical protein